MSDAQDQIKKEFTKSLTGKQIFILLVVAAGGLWLAGLGGFGPFAGATPQDATHDTNAPLSAAQVVERMKSIDGVVDAAVPVPGQGNFYKVTVMGDSLRQGADVGMKALHTIALHSHDVAYLTAVVIVREPLVDAYGKKTNQDVFGVLLQKADIERFDYDNADGTNLLRVGQLGPASDDTTVLANRI